MASDHRGPVSRDTPARPPGRACAHPHEFPLSLLYVRILLLCHRYYAHAVRARRRRAGAAATERELSCHAPARAASPRAALAPNRRPPPRVRASRPATPARSSTPARKHTTTTTATRQAGTHYPRATKSQSQKNQMPCDTRVVTSFSNDRFRIFCLYPRATKRQTKVSLKKNQMPFDTRIVMTSSNDRFRIFVFTHGRPKDRPKSVSKKSNAF